MTCNYFFLICYLSGVVSFIDNLVFSFSGLLLVGFASGVCAAGLLDVFLFLGFCGVCLFFLLLVVEHGALPVEY